MPRPKKPYELKALENKKDVMSKARKSGQDLNAKIQRQGLRPLDVEIAGRAWGEMRTSDEFRKAIAMEFAEMGFLYQPDFAMLCLAADCLERYHTYQDRWRAVGDTETKVLVGKMIQGEAKTFISLSSKLGLDPASRDKFMLNHSLRKALDEDKEEFEW